MPEKNTIFEENYQKYLEQVAQIDLALLPERLGVEVRDGEVIIPFFGKSYRISGKRIVGPDGRKAGYALSVILCKYLLLCPHYHLRIVVCLFCGHPRVGCIRRAPALGRIADVSESDLFRFVIFGHVLHDHHVVGVTQVCLKLFKCLTLGHNLRMLH